MAPTITRAMLVRAISATPGDNTCKLFARGLLVPPKERSPAGTGHRLEKNDEEQHQPNTSDWRPT